MPGSCSIRSRRASPLRRRRRAGRRLGCPAWICDEAGPPRSCPSPIAVEWGRARHRSRCACRDRIRLACRDRRLPARPEGPANAVPGRRGSASCNRPCSARYASAGAACASTACCGVTALKAAQASAFGRSHGLVKALWKKCATRVALWVEVGTLPQRAEVEGLLPLLHLGLVFATERAGRHGARWSPFERLRPHTRCEESPDRAARYRATLAEGAVLAMPVDLKPCVAYGGGGLRRYPSARSPSYRRSRRA